MSVDLDFNGFVKRKRENTYGGERGGVRYAYAADVAMLKTFQKMRGVENVASSVVRSYKTMLRNQYLGTTTRIGPRQFPSLYKIIEGCAETLGVPVPTVYVANSPVINAYTFGTDDDAFIVLHAALIDHFDEKELTFVIGHEMGHIQNKHVVYGTALQLLKSTVGMLLKYIAPPIEVALQTWYRRAEITCDRAGLLCCGDLEAASRSFVKLACGSQKLYSEMSVESYLEQFEDGGEGVGRFAELFASHPYLPKRIQALRVFAESEVYRTALQQPGGLQMDEIDERTSQVIQVVRSRPRGGGPATSGGK